MTAAKNAPIVPQPEKRSIFDEPYDPPGWSAGRRFSPVTRPQSPAAGRSGDLPVVDQFLSRFGRTDRT